MTTEARSQSAVQKPTESMDVDAFGVHVRISTGVPELAAQLRHAWAACATKAPGRPDVEVAADELVMPEDPSRRGQLEVITQQVTTQAITARAGQLLMLHACAVGDPETGRAVVLVGPSGMGKTTLSTVLGRRWSYLTDETAAITDDGELLPYPKPLSVLEPPWPGKRQVPPAELGLTPARGRFSVAALVVLDRRPDAEGVQVMEIRTAPGVALLAEQTSYLARLDKPLQRIGGLLESCGGLRQVTYGEASDLVPVVARLLGGAR